MAPTFKEFFILLGKTNNKIKVNTKKYNFMNGQVKH